MARSEPPPGKTPKKAKAPRPEKTAPPKSASGKGKGPEKPDKARKAAPESAGAMETGASDVPRSSAPAAAPALSGGVTPSDPEEAARADALAARLEHLRARYYAGSPEVSDAAYDALEDELRALAPAHPVLARVGSSELATEWEKARHEIPMGSLNKVVSEEELRAWAARCEELLAKSGASEKGPHRLFVAEKLDGISLEILYRNGRFSDAITRGDGDFGERITANVARMRGVPQRIPTRESLSVRGEIILRLSDMAKHFPGVANPRNAAAGTSKRFDGVGCQHLTVVVYEVEGTDGHGPDLATEEEKFAWLKRLGFATPQAAAGSLDEVIALHRRYASELRKTLDYEIDGLVVRLDDLRCQSLLGELNRRPRGAVAFKFASQAKTTRVAQIVWDTGPSGRVTPVALVEPVQLAGAEVRRASLHNASNVRRLGIGPGDLVLVSRRNDVIPYVEEVIEKAGAGALPPSRCPVCDAALEVSGEYLLCRNDKGCKALIEGRILNWVEAIGALEWGDKLIEQLVEASLVKEPADLYRLEVRDIAELERRGEKSAKKCLAELKSRLPLSLPVFLAALGIEGVALQTGRLLVQAGFGSIEKLLAAKEDELAAIPGLGPVKAGMIARGLAARRDEIARLREAGVSPVTQEASGPLSGKSFCFTGAQSLPRAELVQWVESRGGRVLSGVTKELDYLVIADPTSTSTKAEKARSYGTKLLTWEDVLAMAPG